MNLTQPFQRNIEVGVEIPWVLLLSLRPNMGGRWEGLVLRHPQRLWEKMISNVK
uniref:Uncharacterized protein n=1 Tax=Anguilla anguilla TaxID=7936 RepID=A0A0E9R5M8_ANGAN